MRQSMHGPRRRMVHRPDTVSIHITREGRRTSGPESLIISKFPVRKSRSRKSKVARMARTRQTVKMDPDSPSSLLEGVV